MASNRKNQPTESVQRRFGSEQDVAVLTGISRRTLQADRLFRRNRYPWYKSGRRVLYDLDEVVAKIRASANGVIA
jgi:hypothetical protein